MFTYHMPAKCFVGELAQYKSEFAGYGLRAFIVTDKSSAKNGALADVSGILREHGVEFSVFDSIEENPSVQNAEAAGKAAVAAGVDFIIGIGGGSPMDAAKVVAILSANPGVAGQALFSSVADKTLPVLLLPTTAGTGSETTPFAILTDHERRSKSSIPQMVFAEKVFLNSRYMETLPESVALSSAVDALTHLIEGYTCVGANFLSDNLAISGLKAFGKCVDAITARRFTPELRETLLLVSAQAGMVIAQTKTTLPHQLGYALTYNKNIPHGFACGMLMVEYLKLFAEKAANKSKVEDILLSLGMDSLEHLAAFLRGVMPNTPQLTAEETAAYTEALISNKARLSNCPFDVTLSDLVSIYEDGASA